MTNKELDRHNHLLARELGYNPYGEGIYQWHWSENLLHPMRKQGEYDYKADPETGIIQALPVYELRKLCPHLNRQWVLCMWMPVPSEEEWRRQFGSNLEWPRRGYLAPTNVDLPEGQQPTDLIHGRTWTELIIGMYQEHRKKRFIDHLLDGEKIVESRERDKDNVRSDMIDDMLLPFGHVPGRKDHVSLPSVGVKNKGEL